MTGNRASFQQQIDLRNSILTCLRSPSLWVIFLFLTLPLLAFPEIVFGQQTLYKTDLTWMHFPRHFFAAEEWLSTLFEKVFMSKRKGVSGKVLSQRDKKGKWKIQNEKLAEFTRNTFRVVSIRLRSRQKKRVSFLTLKLNQGKFPTSAYLPNADRLVVV